MEKWAIALLVFVSSCQTVGSSFCDIARPIRLSEAAISSLSDTEVANILAHNKKGERLCKWQK